MIRGQRPFFWPTNALHGATVTCSDSTDPGRAVTWFTDEPLVTSSVASTTIDFALTSTATLAGFLLHHSNLAGQSGATFRVRFSSASPFGAVV